MLARSIAEWSIVIGATVAWSIVEWSIVEWSVGVCMGGGAGATASPLTAVEAGAPWSCSVSAAASAGLAFTTPAFFGAAFFRAAFFGAAFFGAAFFGVAFLGATFFLAGIVMPGIDIPGMWPACWADAGAGRLASAKALTVAVRIVFKTYLHVWEAPKRLPE